MDHGGVRRGDELGRIPCRRRRAGRSIARYLVPEKGASRSAWTTWIFSGPLPDATLRKLALWLGIGCALFTVLSYQILFGAVVSPLHSRTNFHRHDIALSAPQVAADGRVTFDAYVDAGPDTGAAYIISATLLDGSGEKLAQWDGAALAALAPDSIRNAYPYEWAAQFKTERIGFSGQTGARATITLPPVTTAAASGDATYPRARGNRRQPVARRRCRRQMTLAAVVRLERLC